MPGQGPHPSRGLRFILTALLLATVGGYWLPPTWVWGLNHAAWLPWPARVMIPLLGFALIWTPLGARLGRFLADDIDPFLPGRPWLAYGLVPLLGGLVFWFARETTHLLGDGQTLALMLTKNRMFHGFDGLTYHLAARLYQMAPTGKDAAFRTLALISCGSGIAYLAAAAWSARRLAAAGSPRVLLYGLLIFAAPLQLFFGYAEVYAPLGVALLVFLTILLAYLSGRGRFLSVMIAWSVAFLLHFNALFLAPLLLVAFLWRHEGRPESWARRLPALIVPPVVAGGLLVLAYGSTGIGWSGLVADFGPSAGGDTVIRGLGGTHGFLVGRHLKDVLNLIVLLGPIGWALLVLGGLGMRRRNCGPIALVLAGAAVWLALLAVFLHFKLGVARDWDLLAPHAVVFTLAGWFISGARRPESEPSPSLVGALLGVAACLALPFYAVNANEGAALARLEAVTADLAPYPRGLVHEQMAYHSQLREDTAEAERHYRRAAEVCPGNLRFLAIYGTYLVNRGKLGLAIPVYDQALAADSTYVYGLRMAITARALHDQFDDVLPLARRLYRLGYATATTEEAHGVAAERAGLAPEAIAAYSRSADLDPARSALLERAGGLALQAGDLAGAKTIFNRLLAADGESRAAALGLANAIWLEFNNDAGQGGAAWRPRLARVQALIDRVLANPATGSAEAENLGRWRSEVAAASSRLTE